MTTPTYADDPDLPSLVVDRLPEAARDLARERLDEMGRLAATRLEDLAVRSDRNPPVLRRFDGWGERIDRVETSAAWDELRAIAYGHGIPGLEADPEAREAAGGRVPRTVVFALGYLYGQAECSFLCPSCLTDGTALMIERYADPEVRNRYLPDLVTLDPERRLDGAMWLTETAGGSDVGTNETVAVPDGPGRVRLTGSKWFCSNAGADLAMVLARPEDAPEGTAGLGLYALPRLTPDGERNRYRIERLKDKLGTSGLPTGEIELDGALAYDCGGPGEGFRHMTEMLGLSRVWNSIVSASLMRGATRHALNYLRERTAFGRPVTRHPLARRTLARMEALELASRHLAFEATHLWDAAEEGDETAASALRALTPVVKAWTGRRAVEVCSDAVECLGGNGYVEDWPVARMLRDAQVLPIWEGTTNILALDLVRAIRDGSTVDLLDRLERAAEAGTEAPGPGGEVALRELRTLRPHLDGTEPTAEASMRRLLDRFAVAAAGALLSEAAVRRAAEGSARLAVAAALCDPVRGVCASEERLDAVGDLAFPALCDDAAAAEDVRALDGRAPQPA